MGKGLGPLGVVEDGVARKVGDGGLRKLVEEVGVEVVVLSGGGHVVILLGLLVVGDRRGDGLLPGGVVGLHVVVESAGVRGLRVDLDLAETGESRE